LLRFWWVVLPALRVFLALLELLELLARMVR
jgi:hypothetical protein